MFHFSPISMHCILSEPLLTNYGERKMFEILYDLGHPFKQWKAMQSLSLGTQVGILP